MNTAAQLAEGQLIDRLALILGDDARLGAVMELREFVINHGREMFAEGICFVKDREAKMEKAAMAERLEADLAEFFDDDSPY